MSAFPDYFDASNNPPTLVTDNSNDPAALAKVDDTLTYEVTFDASMSNVDFKLTIGGVDSSGAMLEVTPYKWRKTHTFVGGDTNGAVTAQVIKVTYATILNGEPAVRVREPNAASASTGVTFDKDKPTVNVVLSNLDFDHFGMTGAISHADYVKTGGTVTYTMTFNELVLQPDISMNVNGTAVTADVSGADPSGSLIWTAKYDLSSNNTEGAIAAEITQAQDLAGNALVLNAASQLKANVNFDKTVPTVSNEVWLKSKLDAGGAAAADENVAKVGYTLEYKAVFDSATRQPVINISISGESVVTQVAGGDDHDDVTWASAANNTEWTMTCVLAGGLPNGDIKATLTAQDYAGNEATTFTDWPTQGYIPPRGVIAFTASLNFVVPNLFATDGSGTVFGQTIPDFEEYNYVFESSTELSIADFNSTFKYMDASGDTAVVGVDKSNHLFGVSSQADAILRAQEISNAIDGCGNSVTLGGTEHGNMPGGLEAKDPNLEGWGNYDETRNGASITSAAEWNLGQLMGRYLSAVCLGHPDAHAVFRNEDAMIARINGNGVGESKIRDQVVAALTNVVENTDGAQPGAALPIINDVSQNAQPNRYLQAILEHMIIKDPARFQTVDSDGSHNDLSGVQGFKFEVGDTLSLYLNVDLILRKDEISNKDGDATNNGVTETNASSVANVNFAKLFFPQNVDRRKQFMADDALQADLQVNDDPNVVDGNTLDQQYMRKKIIKVTFTFGV